MTSLEAPRKLAAPLEHWIPGIGMIRRYQRGWLRSDLVAGVVLAAILVPQGMAYAELAGLPPVNGLYTTVACLVGYALFGPSRILVLGPDSSLGPMILVAIVPLSVTNDPAELVALAGMLALLVAAIEVGLGLGKLGFVADLLSKEVQVGYMIGLGVTIIVGQLPKLFGFSTDADGFVDEVRAFFDGLDQRNRYALAVGLVSLALLLILPALHARIPAVLITVILSTLAVSLFDLEETRRVDRGLAAAGLPAPQFPSVALGDIGALLAAAIGITLVSLADTIATSTSFAARRGEEVDASQEMIGIGAANAFAGLFQGFPVSTSGSRTAVAEQGGAKSQVTGLVGAALVAIMLVFLPGLLANLPNAALAAIVIAAALSLMDIATRRKVPARPHVRFRAGDDSDAGRRLLRRAGGDPDRGRALDPGLLQAELVAHRPGPRPGRLARLMAQHRRLSRGDAGPRMSSSSGGMRRSSSPTPACSARRSAGSSELGRPLGRRCSARRSPTSTSPRPTCSSGSTTSSTTAAPTSCSWSYAAASTTS